jgi:hypothetical protein
LDIPGSLQVFKLKNEDIVALVSSIALVELELNKDFNEVISTFFELFVFGLVHINRCK